MGDKPTDDSCGTEESTTESRDPSRLHEVGEDDHLTLHTTNGDVEGIVEEAEPTAFDQGERGVTVHIHPTGRSANDTADGFRIRLLRRSADADWEVGRLMAETYNEEFFDYTREDRGIVTGFAVHEDDD